MNITPERAIEILDPTHSENYAALPDSMEQINAACKMGMDALKTIYYNVGKDDYLPTNAEVLLRLLFEVVQCGADEDGYSALEYEAEVDITRRLKCPYINQPLCALDDKNKGNPDAYVDCDACKSHWLMEKWED